MLSTSITSFSRKIFELVARLALFTVYFWFGFLKVIGLSPASDLVKHLFNRTIPFMSFSTFIILFGIFECLIGILFLIRATDKIAISLLFIHMLMAFSPLLLLPQETWSGFLIPTLEGQYILKNFVIIALTVGIAARFGKNFSVS